MPDNTRLPEPQSGPWITSIDPLIFKWAFAVDYNASYAQDTPFFIALGQKQKTICMSPVAPTGWPQASSPPLGLTGIFPSMWSNPDSISAPLCPYLHRPTSSYCCGSL